MSKFKKNSRGGGPTVNTASLPDIVFMLLFYFMVATTSKELDPTVKLIQPKARYTEDLTPYKQRSEIDFIYIGKPNKSSREQEFPEGALSLDNVAQASRDPDDLYNTEKIGEWKTQKFEDKKLKTNKPIGEIVTCIKADKGTPINIIWKIREKLEDVKALKIAYAVNQKGRKKE